MPFVNTDGARVYWSALGEGEPIVLLMGLGCSSAMWFRLAPRLATKHRVILIDNRGVGQTRTTLSLVHRITQMADDVAAVINAAGESSAHVLGFSMGGMIAQELAISHSELIRSLTLIGTNCGRPYATLAKQHVIELLFSKNEQSAEASMQLMRPHTYAKTTPQARIDEDFLVRLANYPTPRGYQAQLFGLMGWSSYTHLREIDCPTLILHGEADELIPPENGRMLAEKIPHAEIIEFAESSHWLVTDQTEKCVSAILSFLKRAAHASKKRVAA
jgi:3-oxoadipate enol-lactonase